jgi:hypothetical protein
MPPDRPRAIPFPQDTGHLEILKPSRKLQLSRPTLGNSKGTIPDKNVGTMRKLFTRHARQIATDRPHQPLGLQPYPLHG